MDDQDKRKLIANLEETFQEFIVEQDFNDTPVTRLAFYEIMTQSLEEEPLPNPAVHRFLQDHILERLRFAASRVFRHPSQV